MDEKCMANFNGHPVKDREARQKATTAGQMANTAMEKVTNFEQRVISAETTANRAKTTADGAVVTARGAYTTAESAAKIATAAETAASNKLDKNGGTMTGGVDMGGNGIYNAGKVGGKVVALENNIGAGEVTVESKTTPGIVTIQYHPTPQVAVNATVRGVAEPVEGNDAANKRYVDNHTGPDLLLKVFGRNVTVVLGSYATVADKLRNAIPPDVHVVVMSYESLGSGENAYTATPMNLESVTLWDYEKNPHLDIAEADGGAQIFVYEDNSAEM